MEALALSAGASYEKSKDVAPATLAYLLAQAESDGPQAY